MSEPRGKKHNWRQSGIEVLVEALDVFGEEQVIIPNTDTQPCSCDHNGITWPGIPQWPSIRLSYYFFLPKKKMTSSVQTKGGNCNVHYPIVPWQMSIKEDVLHTVSN